MQSITIRLTPSIVDNAKVGETEYFLWDENTKGFGVRVRPTGVKSWIVQYRVGKGREAQQRRVTIGKVSSLKLSAAKLRASQYLGKAAFAEDLVEEIAEERRNDISVNDAIDMWISEAAPVNRRTGAPRTPANIKVDVDRLEIHVRPVLGTKRLSKVTKADIELLRDTIASGRTASKKKTKARGVRNAPGGAGTAARAIRVLSSVFAHAEDHELISRNPCRGVKLQPRKPIELGTQSGPARVAAPSHEWLGMASLRAKSFIDLAHVLVSCAGPFPSGAGLPSCPAWQKRSAHSARWCSAGAGLKQGAGRGREPPGRAAPP